MKKLHLTLIIITIIFYLFLLVFATKVLSKSITNGKHLKEDTLVKTNIGDPFVKETSRYDYNLTECSSSEHYGNCVHCTEEIIKE